MFTKYCTFLHIEGENSGMEGGGVDSGGTSPCELPTTSGVRAKKRRGAQPGNGQAFKHGMYSAANLGRKRQINAFIRRARDICEALDVQLGYAPRRRRKKVAPA